MPSETETKIWLPSGLAETASGPVSLASTAQPAADVTARQPAAPSFWRMRPVLASRSKIDTEFPEVETAYSDRPSGVIANWRLGPVPCAGPHCSACASE